MSLREAAQQALEALEVWRDCLTDPGAQPGWRFSVVGERAIADLRDALYEDAPPRPTDEDNQKLLVPLENLSRAAYWVVEGGEFWEWVKDKSMPYAAAKELDELAEMMNAADQATYGMSITLGGKRIDPASIYKQEVPQDHIADANKMVDVQQEMDCYGDGNVYRGQRSSDSKTQTLTIKDNLTVEPVAFMHKNFERRIREVLTEADFGGDKLAFLKYCMSDGNLLPLYTAPPMSEPLLIEGNEFIGDPPAPAKTWGEYFENVVTTSRLSGLRVSALAEDVPETNFGNMAQAVDLKRDDIIRLAREAGFAHSWSEAAGEALERFAALVAAAEREACAKVCETIVVSKHTFDASLAPAELVFSGCVAASKDCAAAIRARGEK